MHHNYYNGYSVAKDAADKIQLLGRKVAKQEAELKALETKQGVSKARLVGLQKDRTVMEHDLAAMLKALWPVYVESRSSSLADLEHWMEADRQYEWGRRLFDAIHEKRAAIATQEAAIDSVVQEQAALADAAKGKLVAINKVKGNLLSDKLAFRNRLMRVRKQKESAESQLAGVLGLIQELNFKLEQGGIDDKAFSLLRGTLSWPANGMLAVPYAPRSKPPVRGIGLALPVGQDILAIASGKVMHNDVLRGFGRVVILLHGQSYYSLYAFLEDSPLTVGQTVRQGQVIGLPGFYPAVDGPGLYFELRFHQKAINPETWLTALN